MKSIESTATTTGSPQAVWALLEDASKWSEWGAWTSSGVEGGGPQRPGAVRLLEKRPYKLREKVTDWVPGERMGYELLEGMPVEGYSATIALEAQPGGGTLVRWSSRYEKAGPITSAILRLAIRDAARRLAKAAGE